MNWINTTLGKLIDVKHGFAFQGEFFSDVGDYILLTPGNCYEKGGLKLKGEKELFYTGEFPREYILSFGDLLIVMTDLVGTAPVLGGAFSIPKDNLFLHNQRLGLVKILDGQVIDKDFLYYLLNSQNYRGQIRGSASGATVRHTSPGRIKKCKVKIPADKFTQHRIGEILSAYDNLIDTNRRRIQLLEEAARLLFREWFVYFHFPGHEKVKIVDLGVRKIPAGWDYLPFTKIKLFKKAPLGVPVFTDTRHYYQTSEIDGTSITGNGEEVDYENRPSRADITPRINTVYFAKMKDTDKVLYFNKGNTYLLEKVLLSTGMVGFTADEKYLGFLFGLLTSYEFVQYKNNFATGATQVSLNDASLKKIKVLFPALNLVELYSEIVNTLLEECSLLRSQNKKLAQARDLLLPRLMSGAIEVSESNIEISKEAET